MQKYNWTLQFYTFIGEFEETNKTLKTEYTLLDIYIFNKISPEYEKVPWYYHFEFFEQRESV